MNNRFARRVKSGEIATISALKSEFKALAKESHPDLAGSGGEDFIRVRAEYESALRNFELHRFGFSPPRGEAAPDGKAAGGRDAPGTQERLYGLFARLLKRGFPKAPRHDKERQRYEYLRWALRVELGTRGGAWRDGFDAFERELAGLKACASPAFRAALRLVEGVVEYQSTRLPELLAANEIGLAALKRMDGAGSGLTGFFELLLPGRPLTSGG